MAQPLAPTKGNLMMAQNTLRLSYQGYEMLDIKRTFLIRELMALIEKAKPIEENIEKVFAEAYLALEWANIDMGISSVEYMAHSITVEDRINIHLRGVMGVELPVVNIMKDEDSAAEELRPAYSFFHTASALDEAVIKFRRVKELTLELAEVENSVYRLAMSIKKTQKRANALQNITIPRYTEIAKEISSALEEKDREEHSRLKVIKRNKEKQNSMK